jgi:hypothetical protein
VYLAPCAHPVSVSPSQPGVQSPFPLQAPARSETGDGMPDWHVSSPVSALQSTDSTRPVAHPVATPSAHVTPVVFVQRAPASASMRQHRPHPCTRPSRSIDNRSPCPRRLRSRARRFRRSATRGTSWMPQGERKRSSRTIDPGRGNSRATPPRARPSTRRELRPRRLRYRIRSPRSRNAPRAARALG